MELSRPENANLNSKDGLCIECNFQVRGNSITVFTDLDGDKNVLTADVVKKLYALRKKLGDINTGVTGHTSTWDKICSRQRVSRGGGGGSWIR